MAQRLWPGDAVVLSRRFPSGRDQRQANERPDHNAHPRCDEVVLERILNEKHNTEEEDEAADPGEKFDAHERFPIDGTAFWFRNGRSWTR